MRFFAPITDAARRVATLFEKWIFLIERGLPDGKESPKKIDPYGVLPRFPFWNAAVLNLFSRSSEDVATRRAAS